MTRRHGVGWADFTASYFQLPVRRCSAVGAEGWGAFAATVVQQGKTGFGSFRPGRSGHAGHACASKSPSCWVASAALIALKVAHIGPSKSSRTCEFERGRLPGSPVAPGSRAGRWTTAVEPHAGLLDELGGHGFRVGFGAVVEQNGVLAHEVPDRRRLAVQRKPCAPGTG